MKNKKYIAAFLLVFALFSINSAELFHHHECQPEPEQNNKCQVCIFNNTLKTALISEPVTDFISGFSYITYTPDVSSADSQTEFYPSPGRAPPAL